MQSEYNNAMYICLTEFCYLYVELKYYQDIKVKVFKSHPIFEAMSTA